MSEAGGPVPSPGRSRPDEPCAMVIFGASGDLTKRLLMPSLYNLEVSGLLPKSFAVVGFSMPEMSSEQFRDLMTKEVPHYATAPIEEGAWAGFVKRLNYIGGDFRAPAAYQKLKEMLARLDREAGTAGNYLFYLATAPVFFAEIVRQLGAAGLAQEPQAHWRRAVVEKPFGHDLASAVELNRELKAVLEEEQIYRIDHYMGKETVQNLMVFRFGNGIFEPVWNRRYIDHVQITAGEALGVENRAGYYDRAGALRDMVPSHLFQLLALVAMEPPNSFEAQAVRTEKAKVLQALQPPAPEEVLRLAVRGQYDAGDIDGVGYPGYRAEPGVKSDSATETFVALELFLDNWRWADVPFYVRTGKRMRTRKTEVVIHFKRPPFQLFRGTGMEGLEPNVLTVNVQPDEGIALQFGAKVPGLEVEIRDVEMRFKYVEYFGSRPSTGYETLVHDCMMGDQTLFQRSDMTEAGWRVVQPVLDVWQALPPRDFPNYPAGSWGPRAAQELLERDGRRWRDR